MPKTKTRRKQQPAAPCLCPECRREQMLLSNPSDFAVEGDLRIVHCGPGMPIVLLDDVLLSELLRFRYKPCETRSGYRFGRVQIVVVPVQE